MYKLVKEEGFTEMIDYITNYIFVFINVEGSFVYNDGSMYELIRDFTNYDLISIDEMHNQVSLEDSNNEYIYKLIQPYVNPQMCETVTQIF